MRPFGSQAAPSASNLDYVLKKTTAAFVIHILKNQPAAQLQSLLPVRGGKEGSLVLQDLHCGVKGKKA